jgi:MazG family protein
MSSEQQNSNDSSAFRDVDVRPEDGALGRSLALVRFLRERCPWDARQTPRSLRPYLLEEAHEVADAILAGNGADLASELGDLLLNVAFQIVLAEEHGSFDASTVVQRLEQKMRTRHPHVYEDAEEQPDWESLKAEERSAAGSKSEGIGGAPGAPSDPFEGLPSGLEPLSRALRLQDRAAALNFDWPHVGGAVDKLREEIGELEELFSEAGADRADQDLAAAIEDELGDVLFASVNVARLAGMHPSTALEHASVKFSARFRALLELASDRDIDPRNATLEQLDVLWEEVKTR